jgi:hypothetical protein
VPRLHIEIHPADQANIVDKDGQSMGTTAGAVSREVGRLMFLRWLEEYGFEHPGEPAPVGKFFQDGRPPERQEAMCRDLIRGLRNDELILCFESLEFWSSSSVLTERAGPNWNRASRSVIIHDAHLTGSNPVNRARNTVRGQSPDRSSSSSRASS